MARGNLSDELTRSQVNLPALGSVGASTSILVCGEPGSSKYKKAEERGIPIVTPTEFADRLEK